MSGLREIIYGSQAVYAGGRSRRRPADERARAATRFAARAAATDRRSEPAGPAARRTAPGAAAHAAPGVAAHAAWLEDGQLLRDAHRLHGIPGVLIHGRLDLSAPVRTAWEVAKAWPDAELRIIEDSGHTGSPAMAAAITEAVARFTPAG